MRTLITGASGGLGRALAQVGALDGHKLILSSRQPVPRWFRELKGSEAHCWVSPENTVEAAKKIPLELLINNAAMYIAGSFGDIDPSLLADTISTNLTDPILLTRLLWSELSCNQGQVININSITGDQGGDGETAYCASKYGLSGFSRALQFDGTRDGVLVTDVRLGAMKTWMSKGRPGWDQFINPFDAARVIFGLVSQPRSLRVTELTVLRRNY